MDRIEKLKFQQSIENYFEENKVYELFEKLLKELIVNKPIDPIGYMVKRIQTKDMKRIFITGIMGTNRKEICLSLAESFGYSCVSLGDLLTKEIGKKDTNARKIEAKLNKVNLVDDETVIGLLKKELIRLERENGCYIIEGFPRNRAQAIFLQTVGLLPDNVIILSTERNKAEERIKEKLQQSSRVENVELLSKVAYEEIDLNIQSVKEVFKGFYSEILTKNKTDTIDEIATLLRYKNKTYGARRPPKILVLGPPCSRKYEIAEIIAKKFNIIHISLSDLLNKELRRNNENSQIILNCLNTGDLVPDKYVFKLLEDRLYASDCMINGWILTGFPKTASQLHYLDLVNPTFKPSLIVIIQHEYKTVEERSSQRKIDPLTGKVYDLTSQIYQKLTPNIKERLIVKTEDKKEVFKKRFENWERFSEQTVEMKYNTVRVNGESGIENVIETIIDSMEFASDKK